MEGITAVVNIMGADTMEVTTEADTTGVTTEADIMVDITNIIIIMVDIGSTNHDLKNQKRALTILPFILSVMKIFKFSVEETNFNFPYIEYKIPFLGE